MTFLMPESLQCQDDSGVEQTLCPSFDHWEIDESMDHSLDHSLSMIELSKEYSMFAR